MRKMFEKQTQMAEVLGLHPTNPGVSLHSTSFAGSIDAKKDYKEFCKNLRSEERL